MSSKVLPDTRDLEFIQAVTEVLRGFAKVVVMAGELKTALSSGGSAVTLLEMKKRFEDFLDERARGKDPAKVRIVME